MRTYVIRRLLLFILSMLVFFSVRLLPGDYVDILTADREFGASTEEQKERLRAIMGLDVPAHIQYVRWVSGILLRGTLGESLLRGHRPVEGKILARVPVTLELGAAALLIGLVIALPVGIYSAVRQDYVRTAWAKGLSERLVVVRHAIKNALIPVVTLIGLQLPILVGGSVIIKPLFNLPGLGSLLIQSLSLRDYPMVSGINLFFATFILFNNLLIDLLYAYLDPRIRYQ